MKFSGLQKLTLLDFPGHMAATLFTAGCNFRCPFCHNASLVLTPGEGECITEESVLAFLKKRRGVLDGVCITGGEPLLQPGLADFLAQVKQLGFQVKLDTNGSFPDRLAALTERGLVDYVAMDVKNTPARYGETIGVKGYDAAPVLQSIRYLLSGAVACEFRTTAVAGLHGEDEFAQVAKLLAGAKRYFIQQFVDSGDLVCPGTKPLTENEMHTALKIVQNDIPNAALRGV